MSIERRRSQIIVFCGDRGCGKTTQAIKMMKKRGYPAVILDRMGQIGYNGITKIIHDSSEIIDWKRKGRIRIHDNDSFDNIFEMLRNTAYQNEEVREKTALIIFEDAGNYVGSNVKMRFIELCTSCRHSNVDLFMMFHSLSDIPSKLYAYCDKIVLFKTKNTVEQLKDLKKITNPQAVIKAFNLVKRNTDKNFCVVINIQ